MLHHLPDAALQDALFRESRRVLRPAGVFIGTDGTDTAARRDLHQEDILVPLDPARLPERLRAAGFRDVCVASDGDRFRFSGVGLRFRPHIHVESRVCRSTHWWTDAEGARNKQPGEGHAVHGPCSGQQGV
jgi:SAM-dependent methyltransferase